MFHTFRLDNDYVLLSNNSNPFCPVCRRIHSPIQSPPPLLLPLSSTPSTTSSELVVYQPELTKVNTHHLDPKLTTPTDPILAIDFEPITKPIDDCTLATIPEESPLVTPLPVDIVNNALLKSVTMSQDALHRAIGFQNPSVLLKHIHKLGTKSVQVQNLQRANNIDIRETPSMHSA
jgi:hypothetical protein